MSGQPKKKTSALKPKRWHGYSILLFILGSLFPPLAVAARFGLGKDFCINLALCLLGYFPSHIHNFYIQNIRNNKNAKRTPKWAVRYGLIDDTALKRRAKRSEWAQRYNDRLPESTLEGQAVEEGQVPDRAPAIVTPDETAANGRLWNSQDEAPFYGQPDASGSLDTAADYGSGGRWHYPANFDDAAPPSPVASRSSKPKIGKKEKKDRWARTEDAYAAPPKKKKSKSSRLNGGREPSYASSRTNDEGPEDALGANYGGGEVPTARRTSGDELNHQF